MSGVLATIGRMGTRGHRGPAMETQRERALQVGHVGFTGNWSCQHQAAKGGIEGCLPEASMEA